MKKNLLTGIFALLLVPTLALPSVETANQHFIDGQYAQATQAYQEILASGMHSATIYYNMGNAYFRMGNYPQAILQYERALRLDPTDSDIQTNLAIANTKIKGKYERMPEIFFLRWWHQFTQLLSTDAWAIAALLLWAVSCGFLAFFRLSSDSFFRRIGFYGASLSLFLALVVGGAAAQNYYDQHKESGVVLSKQANICSSPDASEKVKFVVFAGTKVDIIDRVGDFCRIRIADGSHGWMNQKEIEEI